MQSVASAILIGLAANYLIVAWLHSSITANMRTSFEDNWPVIDARQQGKSDRYIRFLEFCTELLLCPFCLSIHACWWLHVFAFICGVPGSLSGLIVGPAASACVVCLLYTRVKGAFFGVTDELSGS